MTATHTRAMSLPRTLPCSRSGSVCYPRERPCEGGQGRGGNDTKIAPGRCADARVVSAHGSGLIPQELCHLVELRRLDLSHNRLTGDGAWRREVGLPLGSLVSDVDLGSNRAGEVHDQDRLVCSRPTTVARKFVVFG